MNNENRLIRRWSVSASSFQWNIYKMIQPFQSPSKIYFDQLLSFAYELPSNQTAKFIIRKNYVEWNDFE